VSDEHFLSRWSKRKIEARKGESVPAPEARTAGPNADAAPVSTVAPLIPQPEMLPPVETLTAESDFAPFMRPQVDDVLKRRALKTLFQDPRFNVMDGLDVYIDDYSKPDPLPQGWLEKMNQVARLGAPREAEQEPATESNAQRAAEDAQTLEAEPAAAESAPQALEQEPLDSHTGDTSLPRAGVTDS
jgi:hypothetical protein